MMRTRTMRVVQVVALVAAVVWMAGAHVWASAPATGSPAVQAAEAGQPHRGEADLILPDLSKVLFQGVDGHTLLLVGLLVCAFGGLFGLVIARQLKAMPVHQSMLEISELIYETCKTYLVQQGKFLLILELFIGTIIAARFGTTASIGSRSSCSSVSSASRAATAWPGSASG